MIISNSNNITQIHNNLDSIAATRTDSWQNSIAAGLMTSSTEPTISQRGFMQNGAFIPLQGQSVFGATQSQGLFLYSF